MGYRRLAVLVVPLALASASPALASGTTDSTNWAGYAVQRASGFHSVTASWVQLAPTCPPGAATFSSYWVGLGGYNSSSSALEQIGTEMDCTRSGQAVASAWYETVPAPSFTIGRPVRAGDSMTATVTVSRRRALLALQDHTRRWTFAKALNVDPVDVSSAEWIVEAPSECDGNSCQTLPLANFGSATFTGAAATSSSGHTGSLADPQWDLTRIQLRPTGRRPGVSGLVGGAMPSGLLAGGGAFSVAYSLFSLPSTVALARDARALTSRVVHPGVTSG
jgi:hypothetical protein